jgi:uncharacterized protein YceK
MLHVYPAALVLMTIALVASGCGSSKSSTATTASATATTAPVKAPAQSPPQTTTTVSVATGKPLTSMQWIVKGDALCARAKTRVAKTTVKTLSEFAIALPRAAAYYQTELTGLGKLVPPPAKANDWQVFLTGLQQIVAITTGLGERAKAGQFTAKDPQVNTIVQIQHAIANTAKRDGFKRCSQI